MEAPLTPDLRTILIGDDTQLFARSLEFALRFLGLADPLAVEEDLTADRLVDRIKVESVDVVIVELADRSRLVPLIAGAYGARARVLAIIAAHDVALEAAALSAGAEAVVVKSRPFDELVNDLYARITRRPPIRRGRPAAEVRYTASASAMESERLSSLSPREREVLQWLMGGRTVGQIAEESGLSIATVRSHVRTILAKLGVSGQLAAVAIAYRGGWSADGQRAGTSGRPQY